MLKIAICDDNKFMLDDIMSIIVEDLEKLNISNSIFAFETANEFLNMKDINTFDVVFLDIELGNENGVEIAENLRFSGYANLIVFITSFATYSRLGYKVGAFRFILKDNLKEELHECVSNIVAKLGLKKIQCGKYNMNVKDIIYVESRHHKIILHLQNGNEESIYITLDEFENNINSENLIRIHKSYLVNVSYVDSIKNYSVNLINGESLPIPKAKYYDIKRKINIRKNLWR